MLYFIYGRGRMFMGLSILVLLLFLSPHPPWLPRILQRIGNKIAVRLDAYGSILDSASLRSLIRDFLFAERTETLNLMCPTFVTVTYKRVWFDPDFPTFELDGDVGYDLEFDIERPLPITGLLPRYERIDGLSVDLATDLLLRSAGLPTIFPAGALPDGTWAGDGGLIDNLPLNKALEFACDLVVVLSLSDEASLGRTLDQIPRLRRAFEVSAMDLTRAHELYLGWLKRHLKERQDYAGRGMRDWRIFHSFDLPRPSGYEIVPSIPLSQVPPVLFVAPTKRLGGFIRGTLNFSRSKSRWLRALGYADMLAALERHASSKDRT